MGREAFAQANPLALAQVRNVRGTVPAYLQATGAVRTGAKSRTGQRLVLHGTDACPTRRKRLSYTDGFTFLHGETHLSPAWCRGSHQGNSTDPLRLTKAANVRGTVPACLICHNYRGWKSRRRLFPSRFPCRRRCFRAFRGNGLGDCPRILKR